MQVQRDLRIGSVISAESLLCHGSYLFITKYLWAGRFSELVFGTLPLCCKGSPSKSKDVQSFLLSNATYHIRLGEVLLLVPSNFCQGQGANALHSADAVTAWALVVLNRQKKAHGVQDFLSGAVGFVWFFGFFLECRWWEAGRRWRMAAHPRKGGGSCPWFWTRALRQGHLPLCARVPCVTGEKDQGQRGNKSEHTLPTTESLQWGEVCWDQQWPQADFFLCACTHKEQRKAQTRKGSLETQSISPSPWTPVCPPGGQPSTDNGRALHTGHISIHVNRNNVHLFLAVEVPHRYGIFVLFGFLYFLKRSLKIAFRSVHYITCCILTDLQDAVLHLPRKQISIFSTLTLGNPCYKTDSSLKHKFSVPLNYFF